MYDHYTAIPHDRMLHCLCLFCPQLASPGYVHILYRDSNEKRKMMTQIQDEKGNIIYQRCESIITYMQQLKNVNGHLLLPRDAMLARYMPSSCVCLSVISRCSTETAKRRITQIKPHDSPGTLVF